MKIVHIPAETEAALGEFVRVHVAPPLSYLPEMPSRISSTTTTITSTKTSKTTTGQAATSPREHSQNM